MKKNENAFTGLEAAIVLIAFVVVAAVFSYVMLGAGFFTAQQAQTVVHTGMGQAASSIEVTGDVYGFGDGNGTLQKLQNITYTVSLTAGNQPMDIARMRLTVATPDYRTIYTLQNSTGKENPDAGNWSVTNIYDEVNSGDLVLDPNEKFQITVELTDVEYIKPDTRFTISMQPEVGAMTTVVRTTPADIKAVNVLR
jgi:flagellin FlaB